MDPNHSNHTPDPYPPDLNDEEEKESLGYDGDNEEHDTDNLDPNHSNHTPDPYPPDLNDEEVNGPLQMMRATSQFRAVNPFIKVFARMEREEEEAYYEEPCYYSNDEQVWFEQTDDSAPDTPPNSGDERERRRYDLYHNTYQRPENNLREQELTIT